MGRYYSGDIEGKFWFGVQSSDDAEFFGSEGVYLYLDDEDEENQEEENQDDEKEPYALAFRFGREGLEDINEGISICLDELGEYKERFDRFFEINENYNDKTLCESTECETEKVKGLLEYYARLELGMKIKNCVEETGQCCFEAEL